MPKGRKAMDMNQESSKANTPLHFFNHYSMPLLYVSITGRYLLQGLYLKVPKVELPKTHRVSATD